MNDSLGDRMKGYEQIWEQYLPKRIPVIVRVDGKAFHTFTRQEFGREYNEQFVDLMQAVAEDTAKKIQGCNFAYAQSDEISFLLTDYKTIGTQGYFGYSLNKLCSIIASITTASFNANIMKNGCEEIFDARAFSIPQDEVCNYFIWRQQDATRNAIQMLGREFFSHKELHGKSCNEIQEMLFQKHKINFDSVKTVRKRGWAIYKRPTVNNLVDRMIPIFTKDRSFVEGHMNIRED